MIDFDKPVFELKTRDMANQAYSLVAYRYAYGQIRLQLTNAARPDYGAPEGHGEIVREMCTYNPLTAFHIARELSLSKDPEQYCETLVNANNCERPGGRIRLDQ